MKKIPEKDALLPFILLPILLVIATISLSVTVIVMILIGMGALYVQSRPRQKNRSPFFYCWTLSSVICLFLVFEIGIVRTLKVTQKEHFIFLLLFGCTYYFFYKMKAVADIELFEGPKGKLYSPVLTSDSYHCPVCQLEVNERYFHSIWWDCCVFRPNYMYFLFGQVFALMTLVIGTNLGLTTVCKPFEFYGPILLPMDCSDMYFKFR
ncbi:unnamed protein product [Leptidea sinapis]|uniref:Palmitoyltransferase n=1 Tax=Leptidea sinapis TaxID=189913 RepID=A0A5E4PX59_9NEOP|nr:unnamed protein product [Leptidea sinapis]